MLPDHLDERQREHGDSHGPFRIWQTIKDGAAKLKLGDRGCMSPEKEADPYFTMLATYSILETPEEVQDYQEKAVQKRAAEREIKKGKTY